LYDIIQYIFNKPQMEGGRSERNTTPITNQEEAEPESDYHRGDRFPDRAFNISTRIFGCQVCNSSANDLGCCLRGDRQ
jgi:hypothetical protein